MRRQIAAVLRLPRRERLLLASAWFWLLMADLALRALPLFRAHKLVTRGASPGKLSEESVAAERLAHLIEVAAAHHLYPMRCLQRALVLERWLLQRGLAADLQIGVRREGSRLWAHAWVEHEGKPVAERAEAVGAFTPLLGAD